MPRIRGYTQEQRQKAEGQRWLEIIRHKCKRSDYHNLTGLAAALGINYNTLYSSLRTGNIRASTMLEIVKALDMTSEEVLILMRRTT